MVQLAQGQAALVLVLWVVHAVIDASIHDSSLATSTAVL